MPAITTEEKNLLRSGAPVVDYYLAITPHIEVLVCTLDNTEAGYGITSLSYSYVASGDWNNVVVGQTLQVYSAAGSYKGKVRIRAITADTITVAANNDIDWATNDRLHVIGIFEPWHRPTRVVDDGVNIVYYRDTDIEWSSNAESFPPKANGTVGFAGFLNSSGYVDVVFDGQESFANAPGASISAYEWWENDGTFVDCVSTDPAVTIRFSTPGFRWVSLTVTDSNGETGKQWIPVWTFNDTSLDYPPSVSNLLTEFSIRRRTYDVRGGELRIEAFGDGIDDANIKEGVQVCLFARTFINGEEVDTDFGCPFEGRRSILFTGWILEDSVRWNVETGTVTFTVGTIDKVADSLPGYGTFIKDVAVGEADSWHTGEELTIRNVVAFMLEWLTNLNTLAHIEVDPDDLVAGRKFPQSPPLKQIESALLFGRGVFAFLGTTRWGSIHIRYDPQIMSADDRAGVATVMDLTSVDWLTELSLDKSHRPRLSSILGGGIAYDGSDGTSYRARAPGQIGRTAGDNDRVDNLIISGQDDLNEKLGRLLGKLSNEWQGVPIDLLYDIFEPALQEYVTLTVSESENPRGYSFDTSTYWIVRRVSVDDTSGDTPDVRVDVEQLSTAFEGVSVAIPDPDTIEYPPPPPPPPIDPVEPPNFGGTGEVVILGTVGAGVCYTLNALSGNPPTWYQCNDGLSSTSFIESLVVHPFAGGELAACIDGSGEVYVNQNWRGDGVGSEGAWSLSLSEADVLTLAGVGSTAEIEALFVHADEGTSNTYLICVAHVDSPGSFNTRTCVFLSEDWGSTWTSLQGESKLKPQWSIGSKTCCCYVGAGSGASPQPTYNYQIFKKSDSRSASDSNGALVPGYSSGVGSTGGFSIFIGARGDADGGSLARSNLARYGSQAYGGTNWFQDIGLPDAACADPGGCDVLNCNKPSGVGGNVGSGQEFTGPGAMVRSHNGGIWIASWRAHEDGSLSTTGDTLIFGQVALSTAGSGYGGNVLPWKNERGVADLAEVEDGWGFQRGMMASAPISSGEYVVAIRVDTSEEETYIYSAIESTPAVNASSNGLKRPTSEINFICRNIQAFPDMVGDEENYAVLYLGRSHYSTERATASTDILFYVSEQLYGVMGTAWTDKSGNLYALGARGITDIEYDRVRD